MIYWNRIVVLIALIILGLMLSRLVPVVGLPFPGCASRSVFMSDPSCGYWPGLLRGVLLVAPVALFIRTRKLVVGFMIGLFIFAAFGGLEGMRLGAHLAIFSSYDALLGNLVSQAPAFMASVLVIGIGYMFNVIRERDVR